MDAGTLFMGAAEEIMTPILFLDFDGVLNSHNWVLESQRRGIKFSMVKDLDKKCVSRLNILIDKTRSKVVVSSTWRFMYKTPTELQTLLDRHGFTGEIIGVTPCLDTERGHEIQSWMDENSIKPEQIVILDDDKDMVHLISRLVLTDRSIGLTKRNVQQAIELLGID